MDDLQYKSRDWVNGRYAHHPPRRPPPADWSLLDRSQLDDLRETAHKARQVLHQTRHLGGRPPEYAEVEAWVASVEARLTRACG